MGWMSSLTLHKVWLAGLGVERGSYSPQVSVLCP